MTFVEKYETEEGCELVFEGDLKEDDTYDILIVQLNDPDFEIEPVLSIGQEGLNFFISKEKIDKAVLHTEKYNPEGTSEKVSSEVIF